MFSSPANSFQESFLPVNLFFLNNKSARTLLPSASCPASPVRPDATSCPNSPLMTKVHESAPESPVKTGVSPSQLQSSSEDVNQPGMEATYSSVDGASASSFVPPQPPPAVKSLFSSPLKPPVNLAHANMVLNHYRRPSVIKNKKKRNKKSKKPIIVPDSNSESDFFPSDIDDDDDDELVVPAPPRKRQKSITSRGTGERNADSMASKKFEPREDHKPTDKERKEKLSKKRAAKMNAEPESRPVISDELKIQGVIPIVRAAEIAESPAYRPLSIFTNPEFFHVWQSIIADHHLGVAATPTWALGDRVYIFVDILVEMLLYFQGCFHDLMVVGAKNVIEKVIIQIGGGLDKLSKDMFENKCPVAFKSDPSSSRDVYSIQKEQMEKLWKSVPLPSREMLLRPSVGRLLGFKTPYTNTPGPRFCPTRPMAMSKQLTLVQELRDLYVAHPSGWPIVIVKSGTNLDLCPSANRARVLAVRGRYVLSGTHPVTPNPPTTQKSWAQVLVYDESGTLLAVPKVEDNMFVAFPLVK